MALDDARDLEAQMGRESRKQRTVLAYDMLTNGRIRALEWLQEREAAAQRVRRERLRITRDLHDSVRCSLSDLPTILTMLCSPEDDDDRRR